MNAYGLVAIMLVSLIFIFFLGLEPQIQQGFSRLVDIPKFTSKGNSPHLFDLSVRLAYLIAIVGVIRLLVRRRSDD